MLAPCSVVPNKRAEGARQISYLACDVCYLWSTMSDQSLAQVLESAESTVKMLRANDGSKPFPEVADEYTHWIEEQRAWRETCILSDLSHHQTDLFLKGPDALELLADLGVNNFSDFEPGQAKQFVACNPNGQLIADAILFYLEENSFKISGTPIAPNWIQYNLEKGDYDASAKEDPTTELRDEGAPETFRYQIQGPNATDVMEEVIDGSLPDIPLFNFEEISIDGRDVKALGHSMATEAGFEIWGPYEHGEPIQKTIMEVGEEYGIRRLGVKSYTSQATESGWLPHPVPAIYDVPELSDYREWLDDDDFEAVSSLGGSFYSENISDYYVSPSEVGYGRFVDFDHDFVGKEALKEKVENPGREKVTLVWNNDDVVDAFTSLFKEGATHKFMELPMPWWSVFHYDAVRSDGETVGVSKYFGYTYNERTMVSLGIVDTAYSEPGTEVTLVWGEPNGESSNARVERHEQTEIRATVAPVPYVEQ